jgi:hypothetical protein
MLYFSAGTGSVLDVDATYTYYTYTSDFKTLQRLKGYL